MLSLNLVPILASDHSIAGNGLQQPSKLKLTTNMVQIVSLVFLAVLSSNVMSILTSDHSVAGNGLQ